MLATCPDRDDLSNLLLGKLPPERTVELTDHLEACPPCQELVGTIDSADDTLLSAIRRDADGTAYEREATLGPLIDKIKQFGVSPVEQAASLLPNAQAGSLPHGDLGTIRDYRLLVQLGQGGMGTVYKALHTQLDKLVALKVLPTDRMHGQAVARFKREMKAVGKLHHANIVQAFDAGEHQGTHFLVMELVEGSDLANVVRARGPLPIADACELMRQTAVALEYVRRHGMVHRDIKPSNLVLSVTGQIKVLDLGLALLHDPAHEGEELTSASATMGTADYVAPEQTGDSHNVDVRADIYSLGCTLYKLLTGEAPYVGPGYKTPLQKMMAHLGQPFPDVRAARPEVSADLKAILDRMVAKEPSARFATPAEVAEVLAPFCAGHDLIALATAPSDAAPQVDPTSSTIRSDTPIPAGLEETIESGIGPARRASEGPALSPMAAPPRKEPVSLAGASGWWGNRNLLLALAAGGLAILLGVIVMISTRHGTLVLEVEGPPPVIKVDGEKAEFTLDKDGKTYRIRVAPGGHRLSVTTPDGVQFAADDRFEVKWGDETKLSARLEKKEVATAPDRAVALWALEMGASATIQVPGKMPQRLGVDQGDKSPQIALPTEAFEVIELNFNDRPFKHADLDRLQDLASLRKLNLNGFQITDDGVKRLAGSTSIRELHLDSRKITDSGVAELAGMKQLETLFLANTALTDVGVAALAGLPRLQALSVHYTKVSDKGLESLEKCATLEGLNVRGTKVTAAGVARLQSKLPKCAVSWDDSDQANDSSLNQSAKRYLFDLKEKDVEVLGGHFRDGWDEKGVTVKGQRFKKGLWMHPFPNKAASVKYELDGLDAFLFEAKVAINDTALDGSASPLTFQVLGDGKVLWESQPVQLAHQTQDCRVKLEGVQVLELRVAAGKDHRSAIAVWVDPCLITAGKTTDPDRRAAKWVLSIGGTIEIEENGEEREVKASGDLPPRAFELSAVNLDHNPMVDEAGLKHFQGCRNLKELTLERAPLGKGEGLVHFQHCKQLTRLNLSGMPLADAALAHFKDCPQLTHLNLHETSVGDAGLANFAMCENLESLALGRTNTTNEGLSHFNHCSKLTELHIGDTKIDDAGLAGLKHRQALKSLRIERTTISDLGLASLAECPRLVYLNVTGTKTSEAGVKKLSAALPDCSITWDGGIMEARGRADADRRGAEWVLSIDGVIQIEQKGETRQVVPGQPLPEGPFKLLRAAMPFRPKFTEAGLANLDRCSHLVGLDLSGLAISDASLVRFKECRELVNLALCAQNLSDDGFAAFKDCDQIAELLLGQGKFSERALDAFELKQVTILSLYECKLSAAIWYRLAACRDLVTLDVRNTGLADADLDRLTKYSKLRYIKLNDNQLSEAAVKKLAAALPKAKIEWDGETIEPQGG